MTFGLELARQVHGRWPNVLLVITSGQKQPTKAGIADDGQFISKPYRAQELWAKSAGFSRKNTRKITSQLAAQSFFCDASTIYAQLSHSIADSLHSRNAG
jgi:hypothetical protein